MLLPFELIELILNQIYNKKDICNCRLVCKDWYYYLKEVKIYYINTILYTHCFTKKKYYTLDINQNILQEMNFNDYGYYEFIKYNPNKKIIQKIINNPPFNITSYDYNNNQIVIKKMNIKNGNITTDIKYKNNDLEIENAENCIIN